VAASYARTNLSFQRAGVVGINNAYGVALAQVFADSFVRFGGTVTSGSPRIITEVQSGATDYTTDIAAVLEVNPGPQVVYVVAYPPDGVQWMEDWEAGRGANPSWNGVTWLFSEGVFDQTGFLDPLGAQFDITSYRGTAPSAFGGLTGPDYDTWATAYNTKWSQAPGLFDDNCYDAAYLVALAAQKAGSATGQAIKDNINDVANPPGTKIFPGEWAKAVTELAAGRDIDYEGASGSVNIDDLGDPSSGYIVWGVDAAEQWEVREIYPEALVQSLLPAPPARAPMPGLAPTIWTPLARFEER